MGGVGGLRAGGPPADRLARWLDGMETACLTGMRHLDDIEAWSARAETEMNPLSGKTPRALRAVLTEWAPCIRSDGRGLDKLEPCRRSAQPHLDGSAWPDPRDDRAGTISDVASVWMTGANEM